MGGWRVSDAQNLTPGLISPVPASSPHCQLKNVTQNPAIAAPMIARMNAYSEALEIRMFDMIGLSLRHPSDDG